MFKTIVLLLAATPAFCSVVGRITFDNCAAGGVQVSLTTIDFFNPLEPASPHSGCIAAGPTTLTFSGGTISAGALGTVNDEGFDPPAVSNTGFITFPGVFFDLTAFGPGSANLACTNLFLAGDPSCSVFAGSPFILTPSPTGTIVTLPARGIARDATSANSTWIGAFSTQIAGVTPFTIQQEILGGQTITSTYSFEAVASTVPEPVTVLLIGIGLVVIGLRKLRA